VKFKYLFPALIGLFLLEFPPFSLAQRSGSLSTSSGSTVIVPLPGASNAALTLNIEGGLLVSVSDENKKPLDRQAVIKSVAQGGQDIKWQTTGSDAVATVAIAKTGIYEVEVSAAGYLTSSLQVNIPTEKTLYQLNVTLQKDPSAVEFLEPNSEQMPGKARKEVSRGIAALKSGKFKLAEKDLNAAKQLLPSDAEIEFLLGYSFFQQKNFAEAEKELSASCALHPHDVQALTLLARVQIQHQNYAAAKHNLEQAVEANSRYWMAHSLLAELCLKQEEFDHAREQAQLAIENGGGADASVQIVLGQSLERLGRYEEALKVYRAFVVKSPSNPMATQVRSMYDELAQRLNAEAGNHATVKKTSSTISIDKLLGASAPGLTRTWGPPTIDDVKPSVADGVVCPSGQVLNSAGERVQQLVDNVGRFDAIEELMHENLDELDRPITRTVLKYNYVASISEPQPGLFAVGEFRDARSEVNDFPDQIATRGLPALALIFHPDEQQDFQMSCEGLGDWRGKAAWLVRFEQLQDHPHRIQEYRIAGHSYPVSLKGRAWIAAGTFQIIHLESDLMSPIPEIQLLSEHMNIDYGPVLFQNKSVELWLPKSAEIYFDFRRHHYLRRHSFDHFMLFSVDSTEKRNEPATKKQQPEPAPSVHPTG
jgi:tetratricopeptide (TPR) repeat protein